MPKAVFFLRLVNIVNCLAYDWRTVYGIQRHFQQYFSYIMAVSFIGWGNQSTQRKAQACRKSLRNVIMLPRVRFKLTTLVVIGIYCTGSCKSNYYMIMMAIWLDSQWWMKGYMTWPQIYHTGGEYANHYTTNAVS